MLQEKFRGVGKFPFRIREGAGQTFQTLLPSLFGKEFGACAGERVQQATG